MKNCTGERCIIQYDKVDPATCKAVDYCPQATPPLTKADRIRAMSDEELAYYLNNVETDGRVYGPQGEAYWLDLLRQEAHDDY